MTIETIENNPNYKILKQETISLNVNVLSILLLSKKIIPLSIFEKFIIKVLDRGLKENIFIFNNEDDDIEKIISQISSILCLDIEIIEKNFQNLVKAGIIYFENNNLMIRWSENLKNWQKEIIKKKEEKLYFKDEETIEKFISLSEIEKKKFFNTKIKEGEFYEFELQSREIEELNLEVLFILDKKQLEIKVCFEQNNQLFTISEEIKNLNNFKQILNKEIIFIEDNKIIHNSQIKFSEEQLNIINNFEDKNILLKARAGSGKTAVIVERTKRLLEKGIDKSEILLLAFNKKAANEMNERIGNNFKNAKTFHSLAYQLAKFDIEPKVLQDKELSTFIQKIIQENNEHQFFNNYINMDLEIKDEINDLRLNISISEFIKYIRENKSLTFKGLNIISEHKSNGEKYISDFLFEYNVSFEYEKKFDWDGRVYKPDFTIFANTDGNRPNVVLEHWGIDETKSINQSTPLNWSKSWQEYKDEMDRKRQYWKNQKNITFIETSVKDFDFCQEISKGGRASFEYRLKQKLKKVDVKLNKLSDKEIYEKLEFEKILKITKQVEQFINNAKQYRLSSSDLSKKIENFRNNERVYNFYIFANYIFELYKEKQYYFEEDNYKKLIDFNDMLLLAIENIKKNDVENLKYIMIDEYQDFSPLFFELIKKIKDYNPNIKILAVGDDWQAINGFAGANLKYFTNFNYYFKNSIEKYILTNYRSKKKIVDFSNDLLEGENSNAYNQGGEVYTDCKYNKKFLEKIISANSNKKIAILVRNNDEKENIKGVIFETVHKSKGLQYDIVVIKNKSKFDYLHPDNELLKIFDKTEKDFKEENKRLFYVAVTRAKEKLYICN